MKRNKVSKLQMRRLAAGITIALLAGTWPVMAEQSTNPIIFFFITVIDPSLAFRMTSFVSRHYDA